MDPPGAAKLDHYLGTVGIDRRPKAAADELLPPGNRRTSEPGAVRVSETDAEGKSLKSQPKDYPKTVDPDTDKPADDELLRPREGIGFSSRDAKRVARPLDFKAGVHGKILAVGTGA